MNALQRLLDATLEIAPDHGLRLRVAACAASYERVSFKPAPFQTEHTPRPHLLWLVTCILKFSE